MALLGIFLGRGPWCFWAGPKGCGGQRTHQPDQSRQVSNRSPGSLARRAPCCRDHSRPCGNLEGAVLCSTLGRVVLLHSSHSRCLRAKAVQLRPPPPPATQLPVASVPAPLSYLASLGLSVLFCEMQTILMVGALMCHPDSPGLVLTLRGMSSACPSSLQNALRSLPRALPSSCRG